MQETINDNQQTAKEYTDDKPFRLIRHYSLTSNQGNDCQNGSSKNREPLDWILYQYIEKCIHETYPFMGKLIFLNWRPPQKEASWSNKRYRSAYRNRSGRASNSSTIPVSDY